MDRVTDTNQAADPLVGRAVRLFEFLGRTQQLRNLPPRTVDGYRSVLWLDELPDHPAVTAAHRGEPGPDDPILTIDRVARVEPPAPDPSSGSTATTTPTSSRRRRRTWSCGARYDEWLAGLAGVGRAGAPRPARARLVRPAVRHLRRGHRQPGGAGAGRGRRLPRVAPGRPPRGAPAPGHRAGDDHARRRHRAARRAPGRVGGRGGRRAGHARPRPDPEPAARQRHPRAGPRAGRPPAGPRGDRRARPPRGAHARRGRRVPRRRRGPRARARTRWRRSRPR